MVRVLEKGEYDLIETRHYIRILRLGKKYFAWINAKGIGEILVASRRKHSKDYVLATGAYRLYEVEDEPKITDITHLELCVGEGKWQGYILPSGLPTDKKKRDRIIPTKELITVSY